VTPPAVDALIDASVLVDLRYAHDAAQVTFSISGCHPRSTKRTNASSNLRLASSACSTEVCRQLLQPSTQRLVPRR
jgi:hypothetical protein